jgi:hypothetical protein
MLGKVKAFFAARRAKRAEELERREEVYASMTTEERELAEAGRSFGEGDAYLLREFDRMEDAREGRPPGG